MSLGMHRGDLWDHKPVLSSLCRCPAPRFALLRPRTRWPVVFSITRFLMRTGNHQARDTRSWLLLSSNLSEYRFSTDEVACNMAHWSQYRRSPPPAPCQAVYAGCRWTVWPSHDVSPRQTSAASCQRTTTACSILYYLMSPQNIMKLFFVSCHCSWPPYWQVTNNSAHHNEMCWLLTLLIIRLIVFFFSAVLLLVTQ